MDSGTPSAPTTAITYGRLPTTCPWPPLHWPSAEPLPHVELSKSAKAYSQAEFRAIQRAARSDVRAALARIRAGEDELKTWRRDEEQRWTVRAPEGLHQTRGSLLNHVAMRGDLPRYSSGLLRPHGMAPDRSQPFYSLFPTLSDVAAMAVLFQCLTGMNLSTIYGLTTDYSRADGALDGETEVLITRGSKPRRGPNGAEMDLPLSAIADESPDGREDGEDDDFASAFGLYMIAEKVCRRAREFASSDSLFVGHMPQGKGSTANGMGFRPIGESCMRYWKGWTDNNGNSQRVDSRRLRRTFLELNQRPVAQTMDTLADTYLLRDPGSIAANQEIVQRVLAGEVDRIRSETIASVLTDLDVAEAATHMEEVAERFGTTAEKLRAILDGRLDTVATACIDNNDGPVTQPGQPCTASFLLCLGCPNARSEPRHVPVQALLRQEIEGRREELTRERWEELYGTAADQLDDLLMQQRADLAEAASQATSEDADLVTALLDGRLDLR
jgi:hypothetical protein